MDVYVQKLKIKPPPGGVGRAVGVSARCRGQLILWQSLVVDQTGERLTRLAWRATTIRPYPLPAQGPAAAFG